jgi:ribulose 1,5-bisphosphate synthetase/thiazole synthase
MFRRRPHMNDVANPEQSTALLEERETRMDEEYDVVVVGSGIGGMAAALIFLPASTIAGNRLVRSAPRRV